MTTAIQNKRGLESEWSSVNPIVPLGLIAFSQDKAKFKIGDGTSHWADLPYFVNETALPDVTLQLPVFTPEQFGAVGDQVTDDTNAFLEAIDAAAANGGGVVQYSNKRYGFSDVITVKNGVFLVGSASRQNLPYDNDPGIPGLVALSEGAQLKVGDWSTDAAPGGVSRVYVDGNKIGASGTAKSGLIRLCGVDVQVSGIYAVRSGGDGIVYDGLQNSTILGGGSTMHNGVALALDNGAGGCSFHGGYYGTSRQGAMSFRDTSGEGNLYPFGPTNNTFTGGVWESYTVTDFEDQTSHIHIACGVNNIFYAPNFTGGADNDNQCVVLVDNTASAIPTLVTFDNATWWTAPNHDALRIVGNQIVIMSGQHFVSDNGTDHAQSVVCCDGGYPHISNQGEVTKNANTPYYRAINSGSTIQAFIDHFGGMNFRMDENQGLGVRQPTDTFNRWWVDQNGLQRWYDASGNLVGNLQRAPSGNGIVAGLGKFYASAGLQVNGPVITANVAAVTVSTSGTTVTLDASTSKFFKIITYSALDYTIAFSNLVDGVEVAVQIMTAGAATITWPDTCRFAGGSAPSPTSGATTVTFRYDSSVSKLIEISRSVNVPTT